MSRSEDCLLIEFRVENHRSIGPEQVLGLEAALRAENEGGVARSVRGAANPLLPAVALYGANASGKTNLLLALAYMRSAVVSSHSLWGPEDGVRREPFAWGKIRKSPSTFEVAFALNGCRYEYGFVAEDARFLEEWLFAYPKARKQIWFEREAGRFKFSENLRGENDLIKGVTRPNALFLSTAAQHEHRQLMPVFQWFRRMQALNVRETSDRARFLLIEKGPNVGNWLEAAQREFGKAKADERLDKFQNLVQQADVGIVGVRLDKKSRDAVYQEGLLSRRRVMFQHHAAFKDSWLPLVQESDGTRALVRLAPGIIDALESGSVLVIDELESSLHPLLATKLVGLFNAPGTNPKGAQLIFTTHDTNLLGNAIGDTLLRRDQVWLTEKDDQGATQLYPLTDYKPRKAENLERGYLQGRYGAIPFLGPLLPKDS